MSIIWPRQIAVVWTAEEFKKFQEEWTINTVDVVYHSVTCEEDCKWKNYHGLRFLPSCYLKWWITTLAEILLERKPLKN